MSSRLELRLVVSKAIRRSIIARVAGLMAVGSAFRVADTSRGYSRLRSEEHTSELQSLMRISYAVFCLKKKKHTTPLTDCKLTCLPHVHITQNVNTHVLIQD